MYLVQFHFLNKMKPSTRLLTIFFTLLSLVGNAQIDVTSFVYHRFGESKYSATNISTEIFVQQLEWMKLNRKATVSLDELYAAFQSKGKLEGILITVDDAYLSFYQIAFPLVKKYGVKVALFVNTEQVGKGGYMTWDQLAEVKRAGVEIGNHTHTHLQVLNYPIAQQKNVFENELKTSQALFKEHLGFEPEYFAYPYGEYSELMKEVLKQKGFKLGLAQHSGGIGLSTDPYAIPRFPMGSVYATFDGFKEKSSMRSFDITVLDRNDFLFKKGEKPNFQLKIEEKDINKSQIQIFVDGKKTSFQEIKPNVYSVSLENTPINKRRTILTVTAPDKHGKWHWFSKLLLTPEIPES
jgi:peptidoglycan/xylan/chitin deacetylase (PgdA/CDA1 family)